MSGHGEWCPQPSARVEGHSTPGLQVLLGPTTGLAILNLGVWLLLAKKLQQVLAALEACLHSCRISATTVAVLTPHTLTEAQLPLATTAPVPMGPAQLLLQQRTNAGMGKDGTHIPRRPRGPQRPCNDGLILERMRREQKAGGEPE